MKVDGESGGVAVAIKAEEVGKKRPAVTPEEEGSGGGDDGDRSAERHTRRRIQVSLSTLAPIQRLFLACRAMFQGPGTVPSPIEVKFIRRLLDKMKPEDVDLTSELDFFQASDDAVADRPPTITQTTIYRCKNFSIAIFFLPRGAVIPLHDHPGMTVFSRLLLGSLHVKSYDWVDPAVCAKSSSDEQLRLAKLVLDNDLTAPSDTLVLYPNKGGNIHRFIASTPCAILDILGPPYSLEEHRDCTYYQDFPYSHHLSKDGNTDLTDEHNGHLGWLKEIDKPNDLMMHSVEYGGPSPSSSES